ncbi:MAG: preprotein translocase subunit SecY [Clostridiales bacterium]|nr:preprotein translocase subunit SecY [Clostridiales bacterium]
MFKTIIDAFKIKEVRRKILITLLLLLLFRVGSWLPIPGISKEVFKNTIEADQNGFLGLLSTLSGGALANASILALGVSPYINASIIIQLLQVAFPKLGELAKQGEDGKKKINTYQRIAALILAVAQAIGITVAFGSQGLFDTRLWGGSTTLASIFTIVILVAGAMFTVWLGERITEKGIGNGLSLLIFVGILSSAGTAILAAITSIFANVDLIWNLIVFLLAVVFVFGFIVFIDGSERKIPVQYAKQVKGRKTYGGQSNFIPVRVNGSGVMPIIFASALLSFPYMIISIVGSEETAAGYNKILGTGTPLYIALTAILILFFAYFYSQMSFKPEDISKNLQQSGGFINGVRPGKDTTAFLGKVSKRITLFGALFLAFIALVPSVVFSLLGGELAILNSAFSATGMMIVVSCALEFQKQLEAQMITRNYKGFLNK